ncbi:MAG: GNAT family N-acetyltransferase [Flexilinea sp.]|nr:GNAT family N-acetyltransferase [Flexilinea sp.]
MSYVIRKAALSDLNAALQLDREAFGVDAWTFLDYMGVFSIRSVKKFSAEDDGQFAGFAAMEFDHRKRAACLMTLAVRPEFRNRGIGAGLLHTCEAAFPGKNYYLNVDEANKAAIRLYEREGYRQTGTEPGYYLNGHNAIIMEK